VNALSNLTTKELTAIEDTLAYEQVLVKKYRTLAGTCTDAAIKSRMENIANRHQGHYDTLVNYLK
jgi:rubrerythrin